MKKTYIFSVACIVFAMLFGAQVSAQSRIELQNSKGNTRCTSNNSDGFDATFSFNSIESTNVSTEKGTFSLITMDDTYPTGDLGCPTLPAAHKLVAIPIGVSNVSVNVKSYTTSEFSLNDFDINSLMPHQASLRKDQKPEDIKFAYKAEAYQNNRFSERPIAEFQLTGTMRGLQIGSLQINPISYNPVDNTIKVYNNIEVEVRYNDYDKAYAESQFVNTYNHYFQSVYSTLFNYRDDVYSEHPDLWQAPVKMLVVANRMFEEVMQPWIEWKTKKGFYMDVNFTDEIGTSSSAIQTFIQGKYNAGVAAGQAPTFVIIFGDKAQVEASAMGSSSQKVTDLYYGSVDGDYYPDMFYSRMCAETTEQMAAIIHKSLMYEMYTMPDPSYLSNVLLIAGEDSNWNPIVAQPTVMYATTNYYNEEHGFDNVYAYLNSYSGCYNNLNTGVGFANYTAHGGETSWAGPSFTINDVNSLTNTDKYFWAMGNCCVAANWGYGGTCFAEAMIRAENKGAFAYIGSCPNTYWYEDYYFGVGATAAQPNGTPPTPATSSIGVYDANFMTETYNTLSSVVFVGNLSVCYAHANNYSTHSNPTYYWQAYHVLGDGSISHYNINPAVNEVNHMAIFPIGMNTYEVSAAPGSYVAISKDGVLHGTGLVDASGTISVNIDPVTSSGEVDIVVTCPQYQPYITSVPAAALEGAYESVLEYTPSFAPVGQENNLSITFKNVGTEATTGTTNVTLSCEDTRLTFGNNTGSFNVLAAEATTTLNNFTFTIAEGVNDGEVFRINVTSTCGDETWEGKAMITASQAILNFENMSWAGSFEPGQTYPVVAYFKNKGHYMATNAVATISSSNPNVTFENNTFEVGTIDPDGIATCIFNVTVGASCPTTEQITLNFAIEADGNVTAEGSGVMKNSCNVVFSLLDSYGDGWNGCSLTVEFSDGTPSESLTVSSGHNAEYILEIGSGVHVTVSFVVGQWAQECSFSIKYEDGEMIYQTSGTPSAGVACEFDCNCGGGGSIVTLATVENLEANVNGNDITLTWTCSENPTSYIIKRNGVQVAEVTTTEYSENVPDGNHAYCVIAKYAEGESLPQCINVNVLSIGEENYNIRVYPNPAHNVLNIDVDGTADNMEYRLCNYQGQVIMHKVLGSFQGTEQINLEGISKGIYFLQMTTGANVCTKKIVVE